MYKTFSFSKQLNAGNSGEADFKKFYKDLEPVKSEDLKYDFLLNNGSKIEVKCDTYPMDKTPNFFMEYYSDINKQSLGGPWRSKSHEISTFVYYFINDKTFFWFDSYKLVTFLDKYIKEKKPSYKYIKNRGWTTGGFTIPRVDLEHLLIKKDTFK
jgi:hypothetical protein